MTEPNSIYDYDDYRQWLSSEINSRVAKNAQLSVNAFAAKILMSQSLLSLILRGKRKLTIKRAEPIADFLDLNVNERKYLNLLLQLERVSSPSTRAAVRKEMADVARYKTSNGDGTSDFNTAKAEDWILAVTDLVHVNRTPMGISEYIKTPLHFVEGKLKELSELGLIESKEDGNFYYLRAGQKGSGRSRIIASNPIQIAAAINRLEQAKLEIEEILRTGDRSILVECSIHLEKINGYS